MGVQAADPWMGVNGRIWRHTIGRVSNGVRVPVNLIALAGQGFKILAKTILLPATYAIVGIHHITAKDKKTYKGSMSLKGIAVDAVGFLGLIKTTAICFKNIIVAPSKKNVGFRKGIKATWLILGGGLQEEATKLKVGRVFDLIMRKKV